MRRENFYLFDNTKFIEAIEEAMGNDLRFLAIIYGI
jgi:hypothetical protein